MANHDLVVTYKHKEEHNHSLILFIGREPNDTSSFVKSVGPYDFDNAPRCAFWNTAYGVAGRVAGTSGLSLKQICRQLNASPIAFTDASPIPIGHHDVNKQRTRASICPKAVDEHVMNILSLDVLSRVSVVVLSGHETRSLPKASKAVFMNAATQLEAGFKNRKKPIPTIRVPFLFGTNQPAILDVFRKNHSASRAVINSVRELTENSGARWPKAG